jgi:hypothetical protein
LDAHCKQQAVVWFAGRGRVAQLCGKLAAGRETASGEQEGQLSIRDQVKQCLLNLPAVEFEFSL